MLSICDGESENRKFIDSNIQTHPEYPEVQHKRINPYTNGPLSDPPQLRENVTKHQAFYQHYGMLWTYRS